MIASVHLCCTAAQANDRSLQWPVSICAKDIFAAQQRSTTMAAARVVIKKYGNRRLYDTSASRYVNLEEIAGMVRNGTDVQVVDAKTGEDLTRATLMQVIADDTKG